MTGTDVKTELEKDPFVPLRIHLVTGKTVDIPVSGIAFMLRNAIIVLHGTAAVDESDEPGYDVLALRNIERLEQLRSRASSGTV